MREYWHGTSSPVRAAGHYMVFPPGCGKEEVRGTCTVTPPRRYLG
jgi:hypothetical protein